MHTSHAVMLILFAAAFGRLVYGITHASTLVTAVPVMHTGRLKKPEQPPPEQPAETLQFEFEDLDAPHTHVAMPVIEEEPPEPHHVTQSPVETDDDVPMPSRRLFCSCWTL